ncbi:MAG: heparinase II/III family protein [Reichenbachiella sp.]
MKLRFGLYKYSSFLLVIGLIFLLSCQNKKKIGPDNLGTPSLSITNEGVAIIKQNLGTVPLFDQTLNAVKKEVSNGIAEGIDVPIPKDMAGGYTHDQHKKNFFMMQKAGLLFQITGDETYATFIRDMLLEYAKMFPTIGKHPVERSYARGKIFWQCLNDANWLVYTSQAYDCIKGWLTIEDKEIIENQLLRPYADYISIENPQFFNRIHNHSTWGCAAVGMVGLAIEDDELVQRALYGLKIDKDKIDEFDNDGGRILTSEDQKLGFLAQIDELFSPDGFYAEGPYYQRYSMYPFIVFARSLDNARPSMKIFEYRDSVLKKAVFTLLDLTNSAGEFFPINDAQKGMSYFSRELVSAVNIIYSHAGMDDQLLSVAKKHGKVLLDDAGFSVAKGIRDGKEKGLKKQSTNLKDGANGDKGGLTILRAPTDNLELVFKYSTQGMGHGHYDKLSFLLNDGADEIIQDYGTVRYVNIDQKKGGGYLKENKTFGKQTVGHNTIVVNEKTQYMGNIDVANANQPYYYFSNLNEEPIQIISVKDTMAYKDIEMTRTFAMLSDEALLRPIILDLYKVKSKKKNQYDLPFYFQGQILKTNFDLVKNRTFAPLGKSNGYQHIWNEANSKIEEGNIKFNWFDNDKFYSITSVSTDNDQVVLGRTGANDPDFNLRHDPVLILRRKATSNTLFCSVIEPHGYYSRVSEFGQNAYSKIEKVEIIQDDSSYSVMKVTTNSGIELILTVVNNNEDLKKVHELKIENEIRTWTGPYSYYKTENRK